MPFTSTLDGFPEGWATIQLVTASRRVAEAVLARRRLEGLEVRRVTNGQLEAVVVQAADVVCWRTIEPVVIAEATAVRKAGSVRGGSAADGRHLKLVS